MLDEAIVGAFAVPEGGVRANVSFVGGGAGGLARPEGGEHADTALGPTTPAARTTFVAFCAVRGDGNGDVGPGEARADSSVA